MLSLFNTDLDCGFTVYVTSLQGIVTALPDLARSV